jgi:hypothetical protein
MPQTVYYLPGYDGRLATGLGEGILQRGFKVAGRETVGDFKHLPFMEQVEVVANSFGAYLFLNAQAQMPAFPGKVLLLSPIVGEFEDEANHRVFSPPYPDRLKSLATAGAFPRPNQAQIHVGELDWQSVPSQVMAFGKTYVGGLLDRWLPGASDL